VVQRNAASPADVVRRADEHLRAGVGAYGHMEAVVQTAIARCPNMRADKEVDAQVEKKLAPSPRDNTRIVIEAAWFFDRLAGPALIRDTARFCRDTWEKYGPKGRVIPNVVVPISAAVQ
jgi:hypothetical protein